ncbi:MAG TPA: hypothetical protein VKG38_19490, partial [Solirubrobacteraceae bacterium]|nr:hypothetical protein [Solirubrobacteraceae bacterium]
MTIEPPITPAAEPHARRRTKPASGENFERLWVDVPFDDEGQVPDSPAGCPPRVPIFSPGEAHRASTILRSLVLTRSRRPAVRSGEEDLLTCAVPWALVG